MERSVQYEKLLAFVDSRIGGRVRQVFEDARLLKTFLDKKEKKLQKRCQSLRELTFVAIAIILQMTNQKESISRKMFSEVNTIKLFQGGNQLSPRQLYLPSSISKFMTAAATIKC